MAETDAFKVSEMGEIEVETFMSPELKKQLDFKFYNNTNLFVSLRADYLRRDDGLAVIDATAVRDFFNQHIIYKVDAKFKPKLRKVFDSHLQMSIGSIADLKTVAELIKTMPQVLAVEYLDSKRIFGDKASLQEMQKFKSKVK